MFSYEQWGRAAYEFAPFTEIFNLTGQPAISLPVGTTRGDYESAIERICRRAKSLPLALAATRTG